MTYEEPMGAPDEVDLRGLSAEDSQLPLRQALDRTAAAGLTRLRIIHGKGTGALRECVAQLLSADARIQSFRLGHWHEGGSGVTVAQLS